MVVEKAPIFGTLLRCLRLAAGLTQEGLADRSRLSARTISDLERGLALLPRRDTLALLTDALQLSSEQRAALSAAARPRPKLDVRDGLPPDNLPAQTTSFIGRERETEEVAGLLSHRDIRLVTLTGAGGTGKTRLALRVAEALLKEFPDGTFFTPLATASDTGAVVQALAGVLNVPEQPGRDLEGTLVDSLKHRRTLLLFDSFEHLLSGASLPSRLLRECPDVKLLVTSRAPLRISAEQEFPVAPLPVPDLTRLPAAEALEGVASVALFVEWATRVSPDFRLTSENAAAVAAICVRLDGLPLALELAATRSKLLPPRALLAEFERQGASVLRMLVGGPRDLPSRHQTLRDTIRWSHDLLSPEQRLLFRRLAVFVGGAGIDAIDTVASQATGEDEADSVFEIGPTLDGLAGLVDASLVRCDGELAGEARFSMLDTIREFALEELAASGEEAAVRERHARHFLQMVETSGAVLLGAAHDPARLAAEQGNIHAALRWLVASG